MPYPKDLHPHSNPVRLDQLPFLAIADEWSLYASSPLATVPLREEQAAKVRVFDDAVRRATEPWSADNPRPSQKSLYELASLARILSAGDEAVRAHIEHKIAWQVLPCMLRVTVPEFEAAHALQGPSQDISQAPPEVQALARLLEKATRRKAPSGPGEASNAGA